MCHPPAASTGPVHQPAAAVWWSLLMPAAATDCAGRRALGCCAGLAGAERPCCCAGGCSWPGGRLGELCLSCWKAAANSCMYASLSASDAAAVWWRAGCARVALCLRASLSLSSADKCFMFTRPHPGLMGGRGLNRNDTMEGADQIEIETA